MAGVVLTIAATDSGNGAGLTLDLAAIQANGMAAVGAVTAVTAQNTQSCSAIGAVEPSLLEDQLDAITSDYEIKAIKLGLIPNKKILKVILRFLKNYNVENDIPVVWDPIAIATVGTCLSKVDFKEKLAKILPLTTVFTPNIKEAVYLSDIEIDVSSLDSYLESIEQISKYFQSLGARSVLIKGGHISDYKNLMGRDRFDWAIIDTLYTADNDKPKYFLSYKTNRRSDKDFSVHGTGCACASSIAAMLGLGFDIPDAVAFAKAYVTQGIENAKPIGHGLHNFNTDAYGYNIKYFPRMALSAREIDDFKFNIDDDGFLECPAKLGFYVVVDSSKWIERLCKAGVKTLQLRIKNPESQKVLETEIKKAVALGKKYDALVFIDDYWELAIKYGAYGVHLGQTDLNTANLISIKLAGLRLGVSTHGYAEIGRALLVKPSYIALGHIFPTESKVMISAPQGVIRLKRYVQLLASSFPTVAIGGIKLGNLTNVLASGVGSVAVITAITQAEDPAASCKEWLDAIAKQ